MDIKEFNSMLDAIIANVQSQLRAKHKFDRERHNQFDTKGTTKGCGCSVCIARYQYAEEAKSLHRVKKELDLLYDNIPNPADIQRRIQVLTERVEKLRNHYHKLNEQIKKL